VPRDLRAAAREAWRLRALPPRVARFQLRAQRRARRDGDAWTLESATRPEDVAAILRAAHGSRRAAEIGTGTGWTTASLALADPARRVVSIDVEPRPRRDAYLELAGEARGRIELVTADGAAGPPPGWDEVDFLFIDGSHDRDPNVGAFRAWEPALAPHAVVAFHDYRDPAFPGVEAAVRELGLAGEAHGTVFVWRRS
jgi:predicted O-methyltransferase YrrM